MTQGDNLHRLFAEQGQSPWLDNIRRDWIQCGELARWVTRGVRGVTSNPSIFQAAIANSTAYDDEFRAAIDRGLDERGAYWDLVCTDIAAALELLRPVHDQSNGLDGYVSAEVDPGLAHDTNGTVLAARALDERINAPNLYVKIPATSEGLDAIRQMIAEKRSINVTLIFSLDRYDAVIDAYMSGLEAAPGDLSSVSSVASFFISRVDAEVDKRLAESNHPGAPDLYGKAAIANAQLAWQLFQERFSSDRFTALRARGARPQRPLWASTSPKNPDYPETYYTDRLIGPDTVNTMPPATLDAFEESGTVLPTLGRNLHGARQVFHELEHAGIDMADVSRQLEADGVRAFQNSFDDLLQALRNRK